MNRISTFFRLLRTVRHLRPVMVWARLWRPFREAFFKPSSLPANLLPHVQSLPRLFLPALPEADTADIQNKSFCFLNETHTFAGRVDWNFLNKGLLWNYHLNSFMWLEHLTKPEPGADALLKSRAGAPAKRGNEGYPTARRLRHGIRYVLMQDVRDDSVLRMLWQDAHRLLALPEKHLGANHLLENYLSLWIAGMFFNHTPFLQTATGGLRKEIATQFLEDGAHYERSTHYTAQLLAGLLRGMALWEALSLPANPALENQYGTTVARALGWLSQMQLQGAEMPAFGDAHRHLYPALEVLQLAAKRLSISPQNSPFSDSGYRSLENNDWSLRAQAGTATPAFQPGHAHADALSFVLSFKGRPVVTDVGISTYGRNACRHWERSTAAHNTIVVNGQNSAEIWAAFRMGRRSKVTVFKSTPTEIVAAHDGYRHLGVGHRRQFRLFEDRLEITDFLTGDMQTATLRIHFHPDVFPVFQREGQLHAGDCCIYFSGLANAKLESYEWAAGFNKTLPAMCFSAQVTGSTVSLIFKAATLPA